MNPTSTNPTGGTNTASVCKKCEASATGICHACADVAYDYLQGA